MVATPLIAGVFAPAMIWYSNRVPLTKQLPLYNTKQKILIAVIKLLKGRSSYLLYIQCQNNKKQQVIIHTVTKYFNSAVSFYQVSHSN